MFVLSVTSGGHISEARGHLVRFELALKPERTGQRGGNLDSTMHPKSVIGRKRTHRCQKAPPRILASALGPLQSLASWNSRPNSSHSARQSSQLVPALRLQELIVEATTRTGAPQSFRGSLELFSSSPVAIRRGRRSLRQLCR